MIKFLVGVIVGGVGVLVVMHYGGTWLNAVLSWNAGYKIK